MAIIIENDTWAFFIDTISFGDEIPLIIFYGIYNQISNIRCTESRNLNVSHLVLQLPLRNLSKPGVKSRMKM